ncbi:MAG: hypothetical protein KF803_00395 [Cyclobacteriaceae bacterium]|nr:hypothetical protein [Cyclobacteriaceae bacterium]
MENFTPIEFHQARDFSKKMNATFEFLKQNFKSFFKSLLYLAGPPMLLGSILAGNLYGGYFNFVGNMSRNQDPDVIADYIGSPVLWAEIGLAVLLMFVAGVMIVSVVYNYMLEYDASKTNRIDVNIIWERVRKTFPTYLGTIFLYWFLLVVAYFLVVLVIVGAAALSPFLAFFAAVAVIIGLIYVVITMSLLFVIQAFERKNFFEAASRCFYLIKDKWWSTFGLIFILSMVQSTISSIFLVPWYINFFVTMMHSIEGGPFEEPSFFQELINNIFMTLYFLVSFLLYALPLVALAFQYFNLVELKEAKGLLSRIDTLGKPAESPKGDEQY